MDIKEKMRVYAVIDTDFINRANFNEQLENALINGVTFLELRIPEATHEEKMKMAESIKPVAAKYGVSVALDIDAESRDEEMGEAGITGKDRECVIPSELATECVILSELAAENIGEEISRRYVKAGRDLGIKKNIIFDMDGTIVDSMQYWRNVSKEYAVKRLGSLPDDFDEKVYGMNITECLNYYRNELGIDETYEDMKQAALSLMQQHYRDDINAKAGMAELIKREYMCNTRMCIFTSSTRECVELAFTRLGLMECFEQIFTVYDIDMSKNNPDSYKVIADKMGFDVENTWVYEDVLHGVASAKKAGFKVCAIYDEDSSAHWQEIKEMADISRLIV